MTNYLFNTSLTMKAYNRDKWFIMSDYVKEIRIQAESLKDALNQFVNVLSEKYYIEISKTALRKKSKMYRDTPEGAKQIGYVITGKTDFQDDKNYKWSTQYIDIWTEIETVNDIEF